MTVSSGVLPPILRNTLLAINAAQRGIDKTTLRLATGLKVNSALDNPQNYFNAESLSNRAADLSRLLDGINISVRTIEEAVHGTEAIEKLLDQAEAIALTTREELQSGVGFPDLSNVEQVITNANELGDGTPLSTLITADAPVAYYRLNDLAGPAIESTGNPLTPNGVNDGATFGQPPLYANGGDVSAGFNGTGRIRLGNSVLINSAPLAQKTVELVFNADNVIPRQILYDEGDLTSGFTIYIDNGFLRITAEDDAGLNTFADINISAPISAGQTYHVAFTFNQLDQTFRGYLDGVEIGQVGVFNEPFPVHGPNIGIGGIDNNVQFHDGEAAAGNGLNLNGRISDVAIYTRALTGAELLSHAQAINDAEYIYVNTEYDTILNQIDALVEDASFRGINLLDGDDLLTYFNEDRSNTLLTEGVDFTYLGLGLDRFNFTVASDVDSILDDIREARNRVRRYGGTLATDISIIKIRNDFTRETITHLKNGADDLIVADQNEEGANLLALQTRQVVATSVLALNGGGSSSVLF